VIEHIEPIEALLIRRQGGDCVDRLRQGGGISRLQGFAQEEIVLERRDARFHVLE
jgi:hypothetical protein